MDNKKRHFQLRIEKTWDGQAIEPEERVGFTFSLSAGELELQVEAPFHDDPSPAVPPGGCAGLWEFEVVELFLLGESGHYLEIELGPHGHYLLYHLSGIRQVCTTLIPVCCKTEISGSLWRASMRVKVAGLPLGPLSHVNAYAIYGQGENRRYLAAFPVPGAQPDFHQPDSFCRLDRLISSGYADQLSPP